MDPVIYLENKKQMYLEIPKLNASFEVEVQD